MRAPGPAVASTPCRTAQASTANVIGWPMKALLTRKPPPAVPSSTAPTTLTSIHALAATSRAGPTHSVISPYLAGA